jgi:hypothetical protein
MDETMRKQNSTNLIKNVTAEADGLVNKLLNSWTFDSSRKSGDSVVQNENSDSRIHISSRTYSLQEQLQIYTHMIYYDLHL